MCSFTPCILMKKSAFYFRFLFVDFFLHFNFYAIYNIYIYIYVWAENQRKTIKDLCNAYTLKQTTLNHVYACMQFPWISPTLLTTACMNNICMLYIYCIYTLNLSLKNDKYIVLNYVILFTDLEFY